MDRHLRKKKKRKEEVDIKNQAESLVFQSEKALADFGDKVSESDKAPIQAKIDELKKAMEGGNTADIKAKTDELQKAVYDLSSKVYQAAGAAQQAAQGGDAQSNDNNNGGANGGSDDNGFVDAQFTEE